MPQQKIRPWLPPAGLSSDSRNSSPGDQSPAASSGDISPRRGSLEDAQLQLQVLDVTSTAVALSVFTPSPLVTSGSAHDSAPSGSHDSVTDSSLRSAKHPTISIQLNQRPWPHVAHAGSSSNESSNLDRSTGASRGSDTTVIVYGLEPGRDYEISLEVVGPEETADVEPPRATVGVVTGVEQSREDASEPSTPAEADFSNQSTQQASVASTHDGPPPPYSATVPLAPPSEPQLRALLKKIRASSKRTETVLNASISSLRKSVEKGLKEDQRARTRIVGLEEAIRKAGEGEREMRTSEMEACEERLRRIESLEAEVKEELERRKEGKMATPVTPHLPPPVPPIAAQDNETPNPDEGNEEEEPHEGIAELARELDHLNKMIDEVEKETRRTARDTIKTLEHELNQIDGEITQLDREEAHRFGLYQAHRSSDSLDRVDPSRAPPPLPIPPAPSTSNSGFNIRWRKNAQASSSSATAPGVPAPAGAPSQQDPRSFGRFFRRATNNNSSDPVPSGSASSSTASLVPAQVIDRASAQQSYAQAHQALWAPPHSAPPDLNTTSPAVVPRSAGSAGLRQRSGSLTLVPYGSAAAADRGSSPRVASMPIEIPASVEKSKDKSKEKERDKDSSSASSGGTIASSWSRIGTWSQVVTRGPKSSAPDKA